MNSKKQIHRIIFGLTLLATMGTAMATAPTIQAAPGEDALRSVKLMVGNVRRSKDDEKYANRALEFVDIDTLAEYLLGSYHAKATPKQLERFKELVQEYIKLRAFPAALEHIADIDISYSKPAVKNGQVVIHSSILYADAERLEFSWVLHNDNGTYRLIDFLDASGQSAMRVSRDKQVQPILKRGGMTMLLERFETIVQSLR